MHELSCLDLINSDDMPQSYAILSILKNCVCFDQNIRYFYLYMTLQSMIPANHAAYSNDIEKSITYVVRKDLRLENTTFHAQYLY